MEIKDIAFLKPYTGTLVWDCLNTMLGESMRFAVPTRTPQEIVAETNDFLKTVKETLPLSIKEIENALENKNEAQKERYVFGILKHFYPLAFPFDDWLLKWHKEHVENNRKSIAKGESWLTESLNDEEEIIKKREALHKKIFLAYRRKDSTPIEQCLYWFHEYAMIFGGKLNVVLRAYDVDINKVAERFPPQDGNQDCNVYACAILLCLTYSHKGNLMTTHRTDGAGKKISDKQEDDGNYPAELLRLFHNHTELIEKLVGLSDDDVAKKIREWSKEKDKFGKPLIENLNNFGNKTLYSRELKDAGLIRCSVSSFRQNKL